MTFEGTHKAACLAYEDEKFHIEKGEKEWLIRFLKSKI